MRRFLAFVLVVAALTAPAQANLLTLVVDQGTGDAWFENKSDQTIQIAGYQVDSKGGNLVPAWNKEAGTGWRSFQDWVEASPAEALAVLGSAAWSELKGTESVISEGNLPSHTTAQPGFKVSIGQPIAEFVLNDLSFDFIRVPLGGGNAELLDGLIEVIGASPTPWRNATNAVDVDNSGSVIPLDALLVINELNSGGARSLPVPPPTGEGPPPFIDVSGDNFLSPLDALLVINHLNAQAQAQNVPEPGTAVLAAVGIVAIVLVGVVGRRRKPRLCPVSAK